jgi:hypothetical protein
MPYGQHAAEPIPQGPDIFHDDGIRVDFHDIFDIPRVTKTAGDGKPEAGEHPVMMLHLEESGMDFLQEELFASVCAQGDDAGNDRGKVGQKDRHERTSV